MGRVTAGKWQSIAGQGFSLHKERECGDVVWVVVGCWVAGINVRFAMATCFDKVIK